MTIFSKLIGQIAAKLFKKKPMFVIDVSHHNGVIDWKKVLSNNPKVDGAILKATEGATGQDRKFAANVAGCEANKIPWGAYHFATWNNEDEKADAKQEAQHFINRVKSVGKPSLPMVLDIESNNPIPYTKQEMVDFVSTFIKELEDAGYDTAIYASPGFLNSYLPANHPFTHIKLWIADYTGSINPVPGWKEIWLHQYTQTGKCAGVATNCDLNKAVS